MKSYRTLPRNGAMSDNWCHSVTALWLQSYASNKVSFTFQCKIKILLLAIYIQYLITN